jgi:hypothetical protein
MDPYNFENQDTVESDIDQMEMLAKRLFSSSNTSESVFTADDSMCMADMFCFMLELTLHGLDFITNSNSDIFSLESDSNPVIDRLNEGLKTAGFKLYVNAINDLPDDFYCRIHSKLKIRSPWSLLSYAFELNNNFPFEPTTQLENFSTIFQSNSDQLFSIYFKKI